MKYVDFHELAEEELIDSRDYYDNLIFGLGKRSLRKTRLRQQYQIRKK
jgi:hypothetical protein